MSPARSILLALAAGLVVGVVADSEPALTGLPPLVAPIGQLWLRALQMTIVPLVVALLITGICSAAPSGALGRQGGLVAALFVGLLLGAATLTALLAQPLLSMLPRPTGDHASLGASATPPAPLLAGGGTAWIDALLPLNPIRAAADGAMLPLVVFVLLFALALTRIAPGSSDVVVRFFSGVAEAMLVLVGWVLLLAPIGVFAIAVPLVASFRGAAGAVAYYLALNVGILALVTLLLYPVGARAAGVSLRAFARALLPAQTIAATTRSSLASLPAMLDATRVLGTPTATAGFVLPLAVALFRITTPPAALATVFFAAWFHGVTLDVGTIALLVLASVGLSGGVVGVPGQATYFVTRIPMFAIAGLPIDLLGPLLALDMLPDVFRTVGNVTADVTVATLADRRAAAVRTADEVEGTAVAAAEGT